jgi:hypothetical protein
MHPLIDANIVETIRTTGNTSHNLPDRIETMDAMSLPFDRPAENVVIMGCQNLKVVPGALEKFARILERGHIDYTFLAKEYCCGNYLYRPAIKAKDEKAMEECRSLSREFAGKNLEQAKKLGARRLILFCSPCYPIYKFAFPDEDIIYYPQAIIEATGRMEYHRGIDFYAGCYKLHRRFSPVPMDLKTTNMLFDKIEGLSVNRISAPSCCYKPDGLAHMIAHVRTDCMVHICTGCYSQAVASMPEDRQVNVLMLSEFVDMIQKG